MKALLVAVLAVGCGTGSHGSGFDPDGGAGDDDGSAASDGGSHGDGTIGDDGGGTTDGSTTDGGATDGGTITPVPLAACASAPAVYGPLPTGVTWPQYYDPGPLMTHDARAFVFLEGSALWTIAQQGNASTAARPSALAGVTNLGGFTSLAGPHVITYLVQSVPHARTFDGSTFGPDLAIPCNYLGTDCVARAAPDGHLWIRNSGVFQEQTGTTFANRGGGPASPRHWDVDASGAVVVLASGDSQLEEKLAVWKLAQGAGGWTKVGALHTADLAAVAPTIEGGFALGSLGPGSIAPDGSFHVFSDVHCIGTGQRNKTQVYARSRDGIAWTVETLPDPDTLYGGNVTWHHDAFWASDYDNVRYVATSSTQPMNIDGTWYYPDRRLDLVGRCLDPQGHPTFGRLASTRYPGWTTRGYTSFAASGAAAFLTDNGLVQVAPL